MLLLPLLGAHAALISAVPAPAPVARSGVEPASADANNVWLFDNTAYPSGDSWKAEFVSAVFVNGSGEALSTFVAAIADLIGLDGDSEDAKETISERLLPFVQDVASSRTITVNIPSPDGDADSTQLGPSDSSGLINQTVSVGGGIDVADGTVVIPSLEDWTTSVTMDTRYAVSDGWLLISDIDDTIKLTQDSTVGGLLENTFVKDFQPITGMPDLYATIQSTFSPTWFYLSASPYNLYPFLRSFLRSYYPPGTTVLREASWKTLTGLINLFTEGTEDYKVAQMQQIHEMLPSRKVICLGDSTQSDPEAYAAIYKQYEGWVQAIFIRNVTNIAFMSSDKDTEERFETAFDGVPRSVWKVFQSPEEVSDAIAQLQG